MELPPMSCSILMAVSMGTSAAGACELKGPVAILTYPTLPVGETNPLMTVSFCHNKAREVPTPVNTWLTCCGCKVPDRRETI